MVYRPAFLQIVIRILSIRHADVAGPHLPPPPIKPRRSNSDDQAKTMKFSITAALTLSALLAADCAAGDCGRPLARLLRGKSTRICAPASICRTTTSSQCGVMDQPSELNILLTTQLVALRKQVEEMTVAATEQDQALEEANTLVSKLGDEAKLQQETMAVESKRASEAEGNLAKAKNALTKANKNSQQAAATAKQQIGKLKKQNAGLKQRLDKANQALKVSKQALAKAKEENKKKQRQQQEKAIETPPATVKEDGASEDAAGDENKAPAESE